MNSRFKHVISIEYGRIGILRFINVMDDLLCEIYKVSCSIWERKKEKKIAKRSLQNSNTRNSTSNIEFSR